MQCKLWMNFPELFSVWRKTFYMEPCLCADLFIPVIEHLDFCFLGKNNEQVNSVTFANSSFHIFFVNLVLTDNLSP